MITVNNNVFKLDTENTSYVFRITKNAHAEHIYYGNKLPEANADVLMQKNTIGLGSTVYYDKSSPDYCLDSMLLEYSGIGKGDYRHTPIECMMPDGGFTTDFVFDCYEIKDSAYTSDCGLPFACGNAQTLSVKFRDKKYSDAVLILNYTVFEKSNVIARNVELHNGTDGEITVRKLMSSMIDLPPSDYNIVTFDGSWAKEAHIHERPVSYGVFINDSTTGASSNRHNTAVMLKSADATETQGTVIGFNLIYSGNHYTAVEKSGFDTVRIMNGINPHCFLWKLGQGDKFVTPQSVMSYTDNGINGFMENMHLFVNEHIIRENFRYSERPVVINNWEATFFNFNRNKILKLARKAKKLGVEMFVLDDGWFGERDNDFAGLGDWTVINKKKLPGGIAGLCKEINNIGLRFGLWFEPECVNEDSDLYRAHPDWAVKSPDREPSLGRNQMVLDLTRQDVRDYIVDSVDAVLSSANIEYVKWDYNRHISDMYSATLSNQGEFFHRYILGLYDVLRRIFCEKHPNILLESCSSGGNRFDLGMLCFSPQIWTSDDTDAVERLDIQRGIYCFYPPSCVSNHVSMTPNQQTLRSAALSTRFNVAAFGVLGYELDFGELTPDERKHIKEQIEFYKAYRTTFQYGKFRRYYPVKGERESWQIEGKDASFAAVYNLSYHACPARDTLRILCAKENKQYEMSSVEQHLRIGQFGSLINHISPVRVNSDGALVRYVDRHFSMVDGQENYVCSGEALASGIPLAMQYSGTGYNKDIRVLGDWGSSMYMIRETSDSE